MGRTASTLPDSLDWRNHNGINYVSLPRNQGACGSCYAFASVDAFAARYNIARAQASNATVLLQEDLVAFSPQDVLSCSSQNQGCDGGYPFLVGRYGVEKGFISEECFPYRQRSDSSVSCSMAQQDCTRYRLRDYQYIGDFYGGCNEVRMMEELQQGPIAVAINAHGDLSYYHSGIYQCSESSETEEQLNGTSVTHNPWQPVTHAVVIVGYGTEMCNGVNTKFWHVKNSWGANWGQHGYFKVERGINSCGIESMAV